MENERSSNRLMVSGVLLLHVLIIGTETPTTTEKNMPWRSAMPKENASNLVTHFRFRLSEERHRRGWSQQYVADQVNSTPLNVSRWEHGLTTPSPYFRQKLCTLFGMGPVELGLKPGPLSSSEQEGSEEACEPIYDPAIPLLASALPFIGRDEEVTRLKMHLTTGWPTTLAAIYGLPGIGKTALAQAIIYDEEIRRQMTDGILWAALGPSPDIQSILNHWGSLLEVPLKESCRLSTEEEWAAALCAKIGQRKILIVLDDVWQFDAVLPCKVGGPNCAYLLTTRFPQIALRFAATQTLTIKELDKEKSLRLLTQLAPEAVIHYPKQVHMLAQATGGLPLALILMGNYLRLQSHNRQPRRIQAAIARLQCVQERLRLSLLRSPLESSSDNLEGKISLETAVEISAQHLGERARNALYALSVFPAKPGYFTEAAALAVCQEPAEALDELSDAGLLASVKPGYYALHQVIADYARLHLTTSAPVERLISYGTHYAEAHSMEYDELEHERATILTALEAAYIHRQDADLIRGALAFAPFLQAHGLFRLATHHLKRAYEVARMQRDTQRIVPHLLSWTELPVSPPVKSLQEWSSPPS